MVGGRHEGPGRVPGRTAFGFEEGDTAPRHRGEDDVQQEEDTAGRRRWRAQKLSGGAAAAARGVRDGRGGDRSQGDRTNVVLGRRVAVSVDLGGRRVINKKQTPNIQLKTLDRCELNSKQI